MSDSDDYTPPKVWTWDEASGGRFASINRPIAGPTHDKELPVGKHPLQLYSLATPNGVKVTILLEELLAMGLAEAEYDAWLINIGEGEQFSSGFVDVNPNSKIPAMVDYSTEQPTRLFESGSMLLYLAEKFGTLLPEEHHARTEALNWLFWQMGSAPFLGGGFGHFYAYAPVKLKYPIDRFAMETKRQLDVLNRHLAQNEHMAGDEYSIADIAIFPWYGAVVKGWVYDAAEFLSVHEYTHVIRWADRLLERQAVQRGRMVNKAWGDPTEQLRERHDANDFNTKTQDRIGELSTAMLRSLIYDTLIPGMTARWYAAVLERIPQQARVLDVGIGTAGALLANAQTVLKRDLGIVGIDIDADYVRRAQTRLAQSPIRDAVTVRQESVYDHQGGPYDAIYFSASFMLLPEPEQALRHCRSLLAPDGRIYFTQTIQLQRSPLMERLKPMIKRLTSIDFGQVTYEADFKACISAAGLSLSEFCVLDRHGGRASCLAVASAATDLSARDE